MHEVDRASDERGSCLQRSFHLAVAPHPVPPQDFYPESLGVMFIINAPFIFKSIWAFVHPMLEERTRKKIHVLGTVGVQQDQHKWREV
jgi:hypothetical protein